MLIYLVRLVAGLALLVGLFLDAQRQPISTDRFSWAGVIVSGGWITSSRFRPPPLIVTDGPTGVSCTEARRFSNRRSSRHHDPQGDIEYFVTHWELERHRGLWAITDHTISRELYFVTDYPSSSDAEPPPRIREAAALWLKDNGWIDHAVYAKLRTANVRMHGTVPGGWTHTILALSLLVVALVLIPWKQTIGLIQRCFAKPDPGLCSKCGYDLAGLRTGVCPECGEPIPHTP